MVGSGGGVLVMEVSIWFQFAYLVSVSLRTQR